MLATARPIRPGSKEHQQQQRQQQQQQRQQILGLEKLLIDDARLLARRDDGQIDHAIETPRQAALDAFWRWQDGEIPLSAVITAAEPLQREIDRQPAQQMLRWLRSTLAA
jgi:hypothetical protein